MWKFLQPGRILALVTIEVVNGEKINIVKIYINEGMYLIRSDDYTGYEIGERVLPDTMSEILD